MANTERHQFCSAFGAGAAAVRKRNPSGTGGPQGRTDIQTSRARNNAPNRANEEPSDPLRPNPSLQRTRSGGRPAIL